MKPQDHTFLDLDGEALDNHLMVSHGWDMTQIKARGTLNPNVGSAYARDYHRREHKVMEHEKQGLYPA